MTHKEAIESLTEMILDGEKAAPAMKKAGFAVAALDVEAAVAQAKTQLAKFEALVKEPWTSCGACSGQVKNVEVDHDLNAWGNCSDCGAILGSFDDEAKALEVVGDLNELVAGEASLFFDVEINGQRFHGWLDDQFRLVQVG